MNLCVRYHFDPREKSLDSAQLNLRFGVARFPHWYNSLIIQEILTLVRDDIHVKETL